MQPRTERLQKTYRQVEFLRWLSGAGIALVLLLAVLFLWFSPVYLADASMQPTLMKGDTVFYDRLYKHFHRLQRGDLVVFRDPDTNALLIKRIVAMEGESISAKNGVVCIDGKYALNESSYLSEQTFDMERALVPDGHVFVLSDDRMFGEDSRKEQIGCISLTDILGVVRVRVQRFTVFTH